MSHAVMPGNFRTHVAAPAASINQGQSSVLVRCFFKTDRDSLTAADKLAATSEDSGRRLLGNEYYYGYHNYQEPAAASAAAAASGGDSAAAAAAASNGMPYCLLLILLFAFFANFSALGTACAGGYDGYFRPSTAAAAAAAATSGTLSSVPELFSKVFASGKCAHVGLTDLFQPALAANL